MDSSTQLIELLAPHPGERILDLGCGIGELAGRIAESGAVVVGLERLGVLLEQARYKFPAVDFVEADLFDYAPEVAFDAVFAHAALDWIVPPDKAAKRIHGLLKPGGRLAAALGGANETARQLEAYYAPKPQEYSKVLKKAGFSIEICEMRGADLFVLARRVR
ncbi:MAG TPA: class I SAM-dependent methyltransferase [Bryobacteraceae bacterium]|nr:class I SAM-dependent methyltransferase [Bryobacteraceae bacterium]HPT24988.1 class I SAM-dependent methyltransferase [Bryobacteraceae bacterium]